MYILKAVAGSFEDINKQQITFINRHAKNKTAG